MAETMDGSSISRISDSNSGRRLGYRMHHTSDLESLRAAAAMKAAAPAA